MNKKALSKLAKKAANVRWDNEKYLKAKELATEVLKTESITLEELKADGAHPFLEDVMAYLISKYRITKR